MRFVKRRLVPVARVGCKVEKVKYLEEERDFLDNHKIMPKEQSCAERVTLHSLVQEEKAALKPFFPSDHRFRQRQPQPRLTSQNSTLSLFNSAH
jgi:hypothetical protein